MKQYNRVYASIDLDAVRHNLESIKKIIAKETKLIAVIKTDGYGHGAVPIAKELEDYEYLFGFAVATVEEAMLLRKSNIQKPILILGYTFQDSYETMIQNEIRCAVFTYEMAKELSDTAVRLQKNAIIHIKTDTGMGRIGICPDETGAELVKKIAMLPHVQIEGIFTHFAKADETVKDATFEQIHKFKEVISLIENKGIIIPIKHCSNSAGIVDLKEANMDVARAGIILYGLWPSDEVKKENIDLKPVLSLKSRVVYVKEVEAGTAISYGGTFTTSEVTKVATIPVGYGDGYPRSLSNKGYVLIHGQKAKILGRVCMDQFMVDVSHIKDVKALDEVTLVGKSEDALITVEEIGEISGRFNYEFVCDLGKRVPRVYTRNGTVVETIDNF